METQRIRQPARKPRRRNSTRDREQAELVALRRLSLQLHAEFERLRDRRRPCETAQARERMAGAWRQLADRQARGRRAAEQRNAALKARVDGNADWIQRLWELLLETRETSRNTVDRGLRAPHREREDAAVLGRLKQEVQAAALVAFQAFEAQDIRLDGEPGSEKERWDNVETGKMSSRLVCVRAVPFDSHSAAQALWAALTYAGNSGPNESEEDASNISSKVRVLERSHDVFSIKYQIAAQLDRSSEPKVGFCYAVTQQFSPAGIDSVKLFVWRSFTVFDDGSAECNDIMWVAVASSSSCGLASTVAVVSNSQAQALLDIDGTAVVAAMMAIGEDCVKTVLSIAENALLDGVVAGHSQLYRIGEEPAPEMVV